MGEFFTPGNPALGVTIAVGFIVLLAGIGTLLWLTLLKARKKSASTEPSGPNRAVDALHQSYINGEITKEEYNEQLRDLKGPPKN
ncbi:hypothetical protein QL992_05695 [Microbacterium sp. APC 3898]|jgi:putative membrane protein|uniref:SHOCT domain-containing protein n=2 Tax=Planococcus TaxID=1372 RepID=A0ABT7ZN47_9BACL|nr:MULTISPECIES: hypothetical protein [Terrabacteria group]MBF6634043.1 hypothetical protein [Planococcus sp. (in: firmicutes)]MBD8016210.1 hypothetical protein [Planococcus wigleyi]MDN3428600.1 hypothetical protein [Planococcus sp. APC 4016]MDN3438325.1 hypothetical protein [Planococcus sp. APC 3900]MDN3498692.1 hypothetical protein [Microbacterium sp. APC 3898]